MKKSDFYNMYLPLDERYIDMAIINRFVKLFEGNRFKCCTTYEVHFLDPRFREETSSKPHIRKTCVCSRQSWSREAVERMSDSLVGVAGLENWLGSLQVFIICVQSLVLLILIRLTVFYFTFSREFSVYPFAIRKSWTLLFKKDIIDFWVLIPVHITLCEPESTFNGLKV